MPKWKPGQSGNPLGGGPKQDKLFRRALLLELEGADGEKLRKIAETLVSIAVDRQHPSCLGANKEIADRLDGKTPVMVTNDADEFAKAVNDMTDEELNAAVRRAEARLRDFESKAAASPDKAELH